MVILFGLTFLLAMPRSTSLSIIDCSWIECDEPICKDTEIIAMADGGCCPVCKDCSNMACEVPKCKETDIIMPEGACCPICKEKPGTCPATNPLQFGMCVEDCSTDHNCTENQKCCSNGCGHTCQEPIPDCSMVACAFPVCKDGHYTPKGECCPACNQEKPGTCPKPEPGQVGTCVHQCSSDDDCTGNKKCCSNGCGNTCQQPIPDCSMIACAFPVCKTGHYTPNGECCPVCNPDCSNVKCALPLCIDGYHYKQEGECCPSCIKDCSLAKCARLYCKNGDYTPEKECCPVCKPDCSRSTCLVPVCKGTDVVTTPEGECCPVCTDKCSGFCGGIGGIRCPFGSSCNVTESYPDAGGECCIDEPEPQTFCHRQADPGPCEAFVKRFYYDPIDCKCKKFKYGGCGSNGNNFPSKQMCKKSCGSTCSLCSEPMTVGPCEAAVTRFYYDTQTNKCKRFIWGGCQENGNNFKTKAACKKICKKQVCSLPADTGPVCKAKKGRYYYNVTTGNCENFLWGGCKSNGNNFRTFEACKKRCIGKK